MTRAPRPHKLRVVRFPIISREQWINLRKEDVTASVVGALFGLHPYETPAGLWAAKTGTEMPELDNASLRRGRLFEGAVAKAFLEEHPGWKLRKPDVYLRAPDIRLGATPDFFITDPQGRRGVLQTKTVAPQVFKKFWSDTYIPMWITLQTLTETMLAKYDFAKVAALIVDGYNFDLHVYDVPRNVGAERRIQDAVVRFWDDIAHGREPKIDYERDSALLSVMWPRERPGTTLDLRGDNALPALLEERANLQTDIVADVKRVEIIETELKAKMQDAEAAIMGNGWSATFRAQQRKEHTVRASMFRVLRIKREQQSEAA